MFISRRRFWKAADRIGPDVPWTHWRLHFPETMRALCAARFATFGEGAEFRPGAYAVACSKIHLGRRVVIRPGSMLFAYPGADMAGHIRIEDEVLIGSGLHVYTADHAFDDVDIPIIEQGHRPPRDVTIRKGAWLGANVVVLSGVTIGEGAVVGAGSVVTRDIPAMAIAVGNPARVVRQRGGKPAAP